MAKLTTNILCDSYLPFMWEDEKELKIKNLKVELEKAKNQVDLPERYIINENATILFWKDGNKTVVKKCEDDEFNPRLAFLTAFFQHYSGMTKNKANKYLASLEVENKQEKMKIENKQEKMKVERPKFKIGDTVFEKRFGKGKIINITNENCVPILVEFEEENGALHDGNHFGEIKGKERHCYWCNEEDLIKEEINEKD